jgi:hypothetical protein
MSPVLRQCSRECIPVDQVKLGCTGVKQTELARAALPSTEAGPSSQHSQLYWPPLRGATFIERCMACTGGGLPPKTAVCVLEGGVPLVVCSTAQTATRVTRHQGVAQLVHCAHTGFEPGKHKQ